MLTIYVKTLPHFDRELGLPAYATEGSSGADLHAHLEERVLMISPGAKVLISTGISVEIPPGYEIQVRPRSGLSWKTGLFVANTPGTIDADYRGEIKVIMVNLGEREEFIHHGDRIAQLVLCPVMKADFVEVEHLSMSERNEGGFGHTGIGHEGQHHER